MNTTQLLAYWQQLFFETVYFNRTCCDTSQFTHLSVERTVLNTGRLDEQSLRPWSEYWLEASTREVLVAPFCLSYVDEADEGAEIQDNRVLIPLLCAGVLHSDGTLTLRATAADPWIMPTLMDPMAAHGLYVGAREAYLRLLDTHTGQVDSDWLSFLDRGCRLLETLSKNDWLTRLEAKQYAFHADSLIIATDVLPKDHVLFLPNLAQTANPLFQRYCQLEEVEFEPLVSDRLPYLKQHCGQMGSTMLAPDARQALAHLLALQPGQLQSVETPLGSQYQPMIGHLIASQVVDAALRRATFPLMVIVSDAPDAWHTAWQVGSEIAQCRPLTIRWLPESPVHFGIAITKGQMQQWQYKLNSSYIPQAKKFFITQFYNEFGEETSDFKYMANCLHDRLQAKHAKYLSGLKIAQAWLELHGKLEERYAAQGGLNNTLQQLQQKDQDLECDYQKCHRARKIWLEILESRSFATSVFDQLPVFQNKKQNKIQVFLKKYCSDFMGSEAQSVQDFEEVTRILTDKLRYIRVERAKQHTILTQVCDDMASRSHWQRRWVEWQQQFFYQESLPALPWSVDDQGVKHVAEEIYWYLDQALRAELYWFAVHYWEAMWLSDIDTHFQKYDQEYLPVKTASDWRHYAMLGHAFILPLSDIPTVFEPIFLEEEAGMDWLIVEGAQQFLPMEALAILAKADRVIALGDEQGMQPTRAMTALQDVQVVEAQGLAHTDDEIDELGYRGFLASSGSFYRLAQDKSSFKAESPYGLPINTLRLSYDHVHAPALLNYANTAVYKESTKQIPLQPMIEHALPTFGYVTLQYQSQLSVGLFTNQDEAAAIAQWLAVYLPALEKSGSVAILTPFLAQKIGIEAQLDAQKLSRIPVHTFETLAQNFYDRIIFSPTYTQLDTKPLCFDQGAHWLHGAIQHALTSFWVFGDPAIFDPKTHSPSGYLAKLLFESSDNQLPTLLPGRNQLKSELVTQSSLEAYQQAWMRCLYMATQKVILVTPRLNPESVYLPELEELLQQLRARQIEVALYIGNQAMLGWKDPAVQAVLYRWASLGVSIKIIHNCHHNHILMDDELLIEGSVDWLYPRARSTGAVLAEIWGYRQYDHSTGRQLITQLLLDLNRRVVRRLEAERMAVV